MNESNVKKDYGKKIYEIKKCNESRQFYANIQPLNV